MMESASFKSPSGLAAAIQQSACIKGALLSFLLTCSKKSVACILSKWLSDWMSIRHCSKVRWQNAFWEISVESRTKQHSVYFKCWLEVNSWYIWSFGLVDLLHYFKKNIILHWKFVLIYLVIIIITPGTQNVSKKCNLLMVLLACLLLCKKVTLYFKVSTLQVTCTYYYNNNKWCIITCN